MIACLKWVSIPRIRPSGFAVLCAGAFVIQTLLAEPAPIQNQTDSSADESHRPASPLAIVAGFEIRNERVERYLAEKVPGWPLAEEWQSTLRQEALDHLVRRQQILEFLRRSPAAAGPAEIQVRLDEIQAELAQVGRDLPDYLATTQQTPAELRNEIEWALTWRKHLDATLNDEYLQELYDRQRRDFDGTELRVAQILWAIPERPDAAAAAEEILNVATDVRAQLLSGKLDWDTSVQTYSIAPSKIAAGDLGWIRRYDPMPEDFSVAAFALQPGQIAPPFRSRFGVHLIKCLEVRPGKFQLGDVRETVRAAAMKQEFSRLAEQAREIVPVVVPEKR